MKRALIITYYWPPSGGSGVQRWVKFSKYLPSLGWQPVIYTPENPEAPSQDTSLLGDIPPEAEIVKRPIREVYSIYRKLTGKSAAGKEVNPINHQKKSFKQKLMMALRGNFFIPDPRVAWVRPSVKFLEEYVKAFSLAGLERITGVNQTQLGHYLHGRRKPSKKVIDKIEAGVQAFARELTAVHFA